MNENKRFQQALDFVTGYGEPSLIDELKNQDIEGLFKEMQKHINEVLAQQQKEKL